MAKKEKRRKLNEILGLVFLLMGIFVLASLILHHPQDHPYFSSRPNHPIQNPTGLMGAYISHYFLLLFGASAYFISLMAILWSASHFFQRVPEKKIVKLLGLIFFLCAAAALFALSAQGETKAVQGGLVGYVVDSYLEKYFGWLGAFILILAFLLLSLLLTTDFLLFPMVGWVVGGVAWMSRKTWAGVLALGGAIRRIVRRLLPKTSGRGMERRREWKRTEKEKMEGEIRKAFFHSDVSVKVKKYEPTRISVSKPQEEKLGDTQDERKEQGRERERDKGSVEVKEEKRVEFIPEVSLKKATVLRDYALPPLNFLNVPKEPHRDVDKDLKEKSRVLEDTLRDFDIEAKVVEIEQGPTVTRYEMIPAPGVKVSSIVSLSDDLALAMKAASIRILAPIPGKAALGIEVPNSVTDTVYLRELLESPEYKKSSSRLPLTLGKDTSGKPLIGDLADMPHLLIAGTTGSGKTVCVNAIVAGLLYSRRPDELKFVMIDPKMVELAAYNRLPHMLTPVVTDLKRAAATLNWVVSEMENRYKLLASCTVRNIQAFNGREVKEEPSGVPARLPYIVVVIDELADLMMVAQDKVETAITRLAQLSRAVGIHLILATQRPSVDVITGVIKANFPARISFQVAAKVDSRTVLDVNGADKLLGKGDMLFLEPGSAKPTRGQAAYVTDQEISEIVKFICAERPPDYSVDIDTMTGSETQEGLGAKDELYDQAVKVVLESRQASTSVLQRRLRLGYGRAARILDMMEMEGIVGPPQGTRPREILADQPLRDS